MMERLLMRNRLLWVKFLSLLLLLTVFAETPAYAFTASLGTSTWGKSGVYVTLTLSYTSSTDSILSLTISKSEAGWGGYYKFNNGSAVDVSDLVNGPHTLVLGPIATNLQRDTAYPFEFWVNMVKQYAPHGSTIVFPNQEHLVTTLYTEPDVPYDLTFPSVTTSSVTVRWSNGNNPSSTSYTLQRSSDGATWVDVVTAQGINQYTVTGLTQNTTYYFRARVNAKCGQYWYSETRSVVTQTDPTYLMAQQAKSAAEAANAAAQQTRSEAYNAKIAAQSAYSAAQQASNEAYNARVVAQSAQTYAQAAMDYTWDSAEDKSAATLAKEARDNANQALTEINNVKNTVNNIQASVGPQILKISGRNGATCTRTTSFDVVIQASGATEFRVKGDTGGWSSWVPVGSYATATGLSGTGVHTIYVEARNAAGAVATGQMTVFKI